MMQAAIGRDIRIDNVKGGLMILVILGHLLELFTAQSPFYMAMCSAIYVFHMPLFVMTAGMFSKAVLEEKDYRALVGRLIVPLLLFQALYVGAIAAKSGKVTTPALQPHWILWFLLSMVLWRLALPLFARIRYAAALAVLITLAAGYNVDIGYAFSLSRTFYFFPFFLIGFLYRDRLVMGMGRYRPAAGLLLAAILAAIFWWSFGGLPHGALYGSTPYVEAPVFAQAPAAGRALMLALSLAASLAAFAVMSTRMRVLAYLGQRSLSIFVLHGFFVIALGKVKLAPGPLLLPCLVVLACTIALATAWCDPYLGRLYDRCAGFLYRGGERKTT